MPRSTYYKTLKQVIFNRDRENNVFMERVIQINQDSRMRYGAPEIHHLLNQKGYQVSLKRVHRLMKKADVRSITVKKFRPTPIKEKVVERKTF